MKYAIILGTAGAIVPLLVFSTNVLLAPNRNVPISVTSVPTESIRVIPMDTRTFNARWSPVYNLPPAHISVPAETKQEHAETPRIKEGRTREARRTVRKAVKDICARHNMRKVHYGRTWRCRK